MHRSIIALAALLLSCDSAPPTAVEIAVETAAVRPYPARQRIRGDVFHHELVVRVGDGPNAALHIHRVVRELAPFIPRPTSGAIMLLHGDFATFGTNFVPAGGVGMATWLAQQGIDVWGFDRRWTGAPETGADLSDFDAMGLEQELGDIRTALAVARAIRLATSGSFDRMTLVGFSRGGELAYFYASEEATRPPPARHVKGLVPLDVYVSLSPADEELRQGFCTAAFFEYQDLGAGVVDSPNNIQIDIARRALAAPDDPTPIRFPPFPGLTNREALLTLVGQTYTIFAPSPLYHLNAPVLDGDRAIDLRDSPEDVVTGWLLDAPPHQSLRESADTDALTCGDPPLPADVPLSRIRVPLLLIAAAGGYGDHARFSTTQVSSTDVTTVVVRRLPAEREAEDFGHADLLFGRDAPEVAWTPLLSWLRSH